MKILQVNSSARTTGSQSRQLAADIVARLQATHPDAEIAVRDLALNPHPLLDEAALQALFTPAEQRSPEQAARVALDDALIAEIQGANIVVLGVPMYNFGVPALLKSWIDAIAKAGITFRYSEKGPEGLLTGKKVYVALTRGGLHKNQSSDTIPQYLSTVLGFLGMNDVQMFFAEGLALGPDAAEQAIREARREIDSAIA
ncbi:MAG: FMN-dependent NADH-azoreductase [Sideroxydans sp.]|nr:FMN-dependent NADH-azoreductase [Sideroxydans sp.]